jgi:hypothetical protein
MRVLRRGARGRAPSPATSNSPSRANAAPRPRVLARASSCRAPGSGPCLGLHRWAPALRYAPHIIGARALPHPRQPYRPLRCGTAAFRAAPDPDHPPPHNGTHSAPTLTWRKRRRLPARLARSHRLRTRLVSGAALAARTLGSRRAPAWRSAQSGRTLPFSVKEARRNAPRRTPAVIESGWSLITPLMYFRSDARDGICQHPRLLNEPGCHRKSGHQLAV